MVEMMNITYFDISIHALRVEGDRGRYCPEIKTKLFQSTPSVWRATTIDRCIVLQM